MKNTIKRTRNLYIAATLLTMTFSIIYEMFSHQVYSNYMIFAFLIPLIGGVLPSTLLGFVYHDQRPDYVAGSLYNSGIATLTVGSLYAGIIEIYGTTSRLSAIYPIAGVILVSLAMFMYIVSLRLHNPIIMLVKKAEF